MGDQRNDSNEAQHVADRGQDKGREDNAAQPPRTMDQDVDPGSYPPARVDDAVELVVDGETRSFDPSVNGPAKGEGRIGGDADPSEDKGD